MLSVNIPLLFKFSICNFTFSAIETIAAISSSVSKGNPIIIYKRKLSTPAFTPKSIALNKCSSEIPLLMTFRIFSLPASGAKVKLFAPLFAKEFTNFSLTESARKEATDICIGKDKI